ncbi:hypothetical protein CGW93_03575 [candidate division bacterium WOR-3 4484_18]|uniref:Uncharacterized protein n=1 Tax=candidate division WOR-3 bacterium 4484_18 TaxID=2020626 RepID=A0A257LTV9_UNCW3|nr:MAG: hypothetical protein CGW93_03575 [candidate division bacterium WOR-3 4484_18]
MRKNIPLIAVVGNEASAKEATDIIPNINTIVVKKMNENNWISVLPPNFAHDLIFKGISEALNNLPNVMPFKVKKACKIWVQSEKRRLFNRN